ncbi:hypothetical protein [Flavilitoribacter nigricans]|uniref:Uncharacterized protein n=1 Tax=Flavilitoribacter nigricans (strain ATCC 23147 / DSM 23189 / NBRC 102662 / NCIMB 1420 / SS-2) TaxID=1122177 RepID=A0A2D0MX25_FLAN2|nr:hypothetical protein [Flavilitoribacter nigricans]PHN00757.1 hypothetical protein CRP01_40570 [Flavilitoribacter nigricans DSM 23189 = NBRC 102662]
MMTADTVRNFYNATFFPEGRAQKAQLSISLKAGSQEIDIPGIEVGPNSTIDEIIRSFHAYLTQNGPILLKEKPAEAEPDLLNFEVLQYKGKRYFVEEYPNERFVTRRENGQALKENSPTAKTLVKRYKDEYWPKD